MQYRETMPVTLSPSKVLAIAMKAEIDANRVYSRLVGRIENFLLKDKLSFLANEELKHRELLEKLHLSIYPDSKISKEYLEAIDVPVEMKIDVSDDTPLLEVLESAMKCEKASEEFYLRLAKMIEDERVKTLLKYLANMERDHYNLINSDYEFLMQYPDFHGMTTFGEFRMEHLGP